MISFADQNFVQIHCAVKAICLMEGGSAECARCRNARDCRHYETAVALVERLLRPEAAAAA